MPYSWPELVALAEDTPASAIGLSGMSLSLILAAVQELEFIENWTGADGEPTSEEKDAIDAAVALMESEIMSALNLGTMSEQDADAVAITGGSVTGIEHFQANIDTSEDAIFEQDGSGMRLRVDSYGSAGSSLDLDMTSGSKASPGYPAINMFNDIRFRSWDAAANFWRTSAYIRAQAIEAHGVGANGTDMRFLVTAAAATSPAQALVIHADKSLEIEGDINHDGAAVGFMGATPVTRPTVTGSRGGNVALTSLLTALANEGLITNSTSA